MKIRTVIKLPGHKPAVMLMENSLKRFQEFVGGNIKTVTFAEDCVVICNEQWQYLGKKFKGTEKNMRFIGKDYFGPIVFVGIDGDGFSGLTEDQARRIIHMIW